MWGRGEGWGREREGEWGEDGTERQVSTGTRTHCGGCGSSTRGRRRRRGLCLGRVRGSRAVRCQFHVQPYASQPAYTTAP